MGSGKKDVAKFDFKSQGKVVQCCWGGKNGTYLDAHL